MKLNSQREISVRGLKLIPKKILNGLTRDEYTDLWEDNCMLGFIYQLHKTSIPLTYKEIGLNIGWQWRTVKSQHETLRKDNNLIGQTLDIINLRIFL